MTAEEKKFYLEERAKWETAVNTAEERALYRQRKNAQKLKDELYIVTKAVVMSNGKLGPTEMENIKTGLSSIYDELTKLGLMNAGDMRYRK